MMDFITLVECFGPCNKKVSYSEEGRLTKSPAGTPSKALATTVRVENLSDMSHFLGRLADRPDAYLVLGYIQGSEPESGQDKGEPYYLVSRKHLSDLLNRSEKETAPGGWQTIDGKRYATRTKDNFRFSSWFLFDYDRVKGMPSKLETASIDEWLGWMGHLVPGFSKAAKIVVRSTSSRVMLDGQPAFEAGGWHCYVQAKDADDIARFGADLMIHSLGTDYGFYRPVFDRSTQEPIASRPWSIFDPTTFSPERCVYDGKPVVQGSSRLSVQTHSPALIEGKRLDTSLMEVDKAQIQTIENRTGLKVQKAKAFDGMLRSLVLINTEDLKLGTLIETEKGSMTTEEYWTSDHGKLRSQTPFRPDSTSWNAILNRHKDGSPFVFDNGTRTRYLLNRQSQDKYRVSATLKWVQNACVETVEDEWAGRVLALSGSFVREKVIRAVAERLNGTLAALKEDLSQKKSEQSEENQQKTDAKLRQDGLIVLGYKEEKLPEILPVVQQQLARHTNAGHLFSSGGCVAQVVTRCSSSVRQAVARHELGKDYPEQLLIHQPGIPEMRNRTLKSVKFREGSGFGGCPHLLAQNLVEGPSSWLPPLTGFLEHPVVLMNGDVLTQQDYDPRTGLYCDFHPSLTECMVAHPGRNEAEEALEFILEEVLADFPYADDRSMAAHITMFLTALDRRFLGIAPGFVVHAGRQSTGKTAAVDMVFRIIYGRPAAATAWAKTDEEFTKHLIGILREGQPAVLFDNLKDGATVNSPELAKLLTSEFYAGRQLGKNKTFSFSSSIMVAITGNRLTVSGDLMSRLVPIELKARTEQVTRRIFVRKNLSEWCTTNRPKVLAALLCILQAYRRSGERLEVSPTRFPEWDARIRAPLEWLGLPDTSNLMIENEASNPEREFIVRFLRSWWKEFGVDWVPLSRVSSFYKNLGPPDYEPPPLEGSFAEALMELFPMTTQNKKLSKTRSLSYALRGKLLGAVYDGLMLERSDGPRGHENALHYRIVVVDEPEGYDDF